MKSKFEKGPSHSNNKILVSNEILSSTGIKLEELNQHLIQLKSTLGANVVHVVPKNINSVPLLFWIINLSQSFQKLRQCEGFEQHIKTYTEKQIQSSYFVTATARYLLEKGGNIVLEPLLTTKTKKPDIFVEFNGEKAYLECKHTETRKFDYLEEHNNVFSILRDYIHVPHQIDIQYKKSISHSDWRELGKTIEQRLGEITGDGRIVDNENIQVQVMKRDMHSDKRFFVILEGISEDLHENCRYPLHAYSKEGITLSLSGPRVDFKNTLREKLRRSKDQASQQYPYLLLIDGSQMLGELEQNLRTLTTAFQPDMNTRFSAAVIAEYHPRLDKPDLNLRFYIVPNPFARFPVSKRFERLFQ